ncbi:S41 family peptidase [Algoriphagus sp. SE2]|uniref:S41 family peptidase n=1 Tax=Algoriphagus sp. SE2 TaxID=3141536 RepID=UPI0031CCDA4F
MKATIITFFFFISQLPVFGQTIEKELALNDLTFLRKNIQEYNPALYDYNPNFDSLSSVVMNSLEGDSISIFEYFTLVSEICALSNEGHFNLGNWLDTVHKGIPDNTYPYLPVSVKLISNELYVWDDYSNEQLLKRGDKIISINGRTVADILEKLHKVSPSDGDILTYSNKNIEIGFPWLYFFHIERTDAYQFEYTRDKEEQKTATIQALIRSNQVANVKKYISDDDNPQQTELNSFYDLQFEENYAVLKLPSFDNSKVNQYKVKSTVMYKSIFGELAEKNVNQLIIDLRDNTGGRNEFADDMIPFILKPDNADTFLKKSISWEGKERVYNMPKPSKLAFRGKIYVLVNGKTFSSGSTLARYLNEYADAIMIGEETGSRYEGYAAGSKQLVVLPNSKLEIGIPRYHIFYPKSAKQNTVNRGVLPDYEIIYSLEDIERNRDLHFEKALLLIVGEN